MIGFAIQNYIPVIAANPPRCYVSMMSRGMKLLVSLSKEGKKYLPPLPYDTLSGPYREKIYGNHEKEARVPVGLIFITARDYGMRE